MLRDPSLSPSDFRRRRRPSHRPTCRSTTISTVSGISARASPSRPAASRCRGDALVRDAGAGPVVADRPADAGRAIARRRLVYLLASRYCETDRLPDTAWSLFGNTRRAGSGCRRSSTLPRPRHFGYEHARPTKTAWDALLGSSGVCRDFAHLAITLCRCMNIPARYCTGYLGDIGIPPIPRRWISPAGSRPICRQMVHLRRAPRRAADRPHPDGAWRDATDVALSTGFGRMNLAKFFVVSDEVKA